MKTLNIKGYHYNPNVKSRVGTCIYNSDDYRDTYIKITPSSIDNCVVIVSFYFNSEEVYIEAVLRTNDSDFEAWINELSESLNARFNKH